MRLMLVNDDGIDSPGLVALAAALAQDGHRIYVVAPDRERSSIGHAITLHQNLHLWPFSGLYPTGVEAWSCDGTPTDCVGLGMDVVCPDADMIVSGINKGANLSDDLTYSGTVCAAMEGLEHGYKSVAVSLVCDGQTERYFDTAASVARSVVEWFSSTHIPGVLMNVNVPNVPLSDFGGIVPTRQGRRTYVEKLTTLTEPDGSSAYRLGGYPEDVLEDGTDVWAISNGCAAITPVHLDMTEYGTLRLMREGLFKAF